MIHLTAYVNNPSDGQSVIGYVVWYSEVMTKPSNLAAIEETTKISWEDWVTYLDEHNARELVHRAIADLAYDKLKDSLDNAGWWSQSVAVAYEQHIGRRQPGQRSDGTFEATVSKTIDGSMDNGLEIWLKLIDTKQKFDGTTLAGAASITKPKGRRHWAVNLADGSRLNADAYPKGENKSSLTITHTKLTDQAAAERWRAYWKGFLTVS